MLRTCLALIVLIACYADSAAGETCVSSKCHAELLSYPVKHRVEACDSCHAKADHDKRQFTYVAAGRRLCAQCHVTLEARYRHAANQASCTVCHDPHGSKDRGLLKATPVAELCRICHPSAGKAQSTHKPYEAGECTNCHEAHQSNQRFLLRKPRDELCFGCHPASKLLAQAYDHPPVERGQCLRCHEAHQSDQPHLLKKPTAQLCRDCHTKTPNLKQKHLHGALEDRSCDGCHRPHTSPNAKLLAQKMPALCYECHDSVGAGPVVHGAVLLGRCGGCHDPHASASAKLLRPFGRGMGDICFNCHCDDVTHRKSVHWPVKGRQCDECHEPHVAQRKKLLKKPIHDLCRKCHADKEAPAGSRVHGALARAGCVACHDPHATDNDRLLKAPVNQLCGTCHPKQRSGRHVFLTPHGPHPVSGVADPLHAGRSLSCISCHAMSSSSQPKLLRGGPTKAEMCKRCHTRRPGQLRRDISGAEKLLHNYQPAKVN